MKRIRKFTTLIMLVMPIWFFSCDVDKTQQGEMPEVDVDVEEGEMPEYDVDWMNVDVATTTKTVEVPKVTVVMEEEEVEVPVVNVNMPDDSANVERTIRVETEVSDEMRKVDIKELYATENRIYVIAELERTGEQLQDQTVRVSDQVVINAPEDLIVTHYIIGEKPDRVFNDDYNYIASRNEISDKLQGGKTIYSD